MIGKHYNIYTFLKDISSKYGARPALFGRQKTSQGDQWNSLSFSKIHTSAEKVAQKLLSLGLKKGNRILLIAKSRPEFSVGFFAIPLAGGVIVPLDANLSLKDQKFVSEFSEAQFILCLQEDSAVAEKIAEASAQGPQILKIEEVMSQESAAESDLNKSVLQPEEVFLMAFTSGTTSQPKAVMLTFNNIYFQIISAAKIFGSKLDFRLLSILPLHHMFEITCGFLLPFSQGGSVYYGNSLVPHQIISFFKEHKIRNLLVVPLFLKTLKKGIENEINSSFLRKMWFQLSFKIASLIPLNSIRRLIFAPIHKKFGGELHQIISGASALDPKVSHFFDVLGISVYEGYGMTETAPVISCTSPQHKKAGSIGKALPGVEVRLDPATQEILVRGPNVMKGYFNNPTATAACLSEGWFNTGDVGHIDSEGFLSIRGRSKDLIVLSNGKKVVPEEIEDTFREIPGVQEVCVLGTTSNHGPTKGTDVVTAVVVLNPAQNSLQDNGQRDKVQKDLDHATRLLSYYKRPAKFVFLNEPLPKTTTLKVKKNLVKELILKQESF
ncbi:MAG: AMP-dependent synthetase/ligase [Pseudobdellovibrionaceae bacterium]